jgi:hypothetical protein
LFKRESWERRPRNHNIARSLRSRCWRLVWMYFRQVRWRSRCSPRYLTSDFTGIGVVCRNTGGQVTCRVVKVTCADFAALTRIFHISNQSWRRVKWLWNSRARSITPPPKSNGPLSSGLAIPPHQTWQTVKKRKWTHLTPDTSQPGVSSPFTSRNRFYELSHFSDDDMQGLLNLYRSRNSFCLLTCILLYTRICKSSWILHQMV